jgi:hypothetical protein
MLPGMGPDPVVDMIAETIEGDLREDGALSIKLEPYEGLSLRIVGMLPTLFGHDRGCIHAGLDASSR